MTKLRQANVGNYMKKNIFTFDFHILPEDRRIGGRIFLSLYFNKKGDHT